MQVIVRENNVDQALRVLKKKMQREGIFREMKARRADEKPSERRGRQKAEAIRRARKAARKLAKAGFSRVYWLDGGLAAWQQADLPLSRK